MPCGLLVAALVVLTAGAARSEPAGRAAVLVGIGHYADPELPPLEGPPADAAAMRTLLVDDLGFDPRAVVTLIDAAATREGILRALAAMTARARRGDVLVFYFSGHGARIFDSSGDEPDGWDEGLVPHDSGRGGRPNLDIVDDELNAVLDAMVARGAHVTFVFDSCHAGTGTRDPLAVARSAPADRRFRAITASPGPQIDAVSRRWTLVAAARQDQLAYERPLGDDGRRRGILTHSLIAALRAAPPGASLRDVFEPMRAAVQLIEPRQDPQLEGPGADRAPFGVERRPTEPYVLADPTPDGVRIQAGEVHGVAPGAIYAIAPPGSPRAPADAPLARVVDVGGTTARSTVDPDVVVAPASRAFLRVEGSARRRVPLSIEADPDWPLSGPLRAALAQQPTVAVLPRWGRRAARLVIRGRADAVRIEDARGRTHDVVAMPSDAIAVVDRVMPWVRWHAIAGLASEHRLPVRFTAGEGGPHQVSARAGDALTLAVDNGGSTDLYLTLVALGSDGSIAVIYPLPGVNAYVQAFGRWQQTVEATVPPGAREAEDRLKLIVTDRPTDFRFLQQGPAGDGAKGLRDLETLWTALGIGAGAKGGDGGVWATRDLTIVTHR